MPTPQQVRLRYSKFANPASLGERYRLAGRGFANCTDSKFISLTLSGGSDKSQYLFSAGYLKQDGIIINSVFDRYSLGLNLDNQVTSHLKIGNSLNLTRSSTSAAKQ